MRVRELGWREGVERREQSNAKRELETKCERKSEGK